MYNLAYYFSQFKILNYRIFTFNSKTIECTLCINNYSIASDRICLTTWVHTLEPRHCQQRQHL